MVSNPRLARHASASFAPDACASGCCMPDGDSLMELAIFLDAHAVAGDAALLAAVRGAA